MEKSVKNVITRVEKCDYGEWNYILFTETLENAKSSGNAYAKRQMFTFIDNQNHTYV